MKFDLININTSSYFCHMIPYNRKFTRTRLNALGLSSTFLGLRVFGNRKTTDLEEAKALRHNHEATDIYSCSWGPPDTGWETDGPGALAKEAMLEGVTKVREHHDPNFAAAILIPILL